MSGPTIEVSQFIEHRKLGLADIGLIALAFWLVVAWNLGIACSAMVLVPRRRCCG